jgi:opacity protein-like surface antigen
VEINENATLQVALGQPGAETTVNPLWGEDAGTVYQYSSTNNYLPSLEAALDLTFGNFSIGLGAGVAYNTWKMDEQGASDLLSAMYQAVGYPPVSVTFEDDKALSYLLWVPIEYSNGPFHGVINLHYGQNVDTNWTGGNTSEFGSEFADLAGNGIYGGQPGSLPMAKFEQVGMNPSGTLLMNYSMEDTTQWGIGIDLNFALTEKLTLALGGGVTQLQNDAWEFWAQEMAARGAPVANISDNYTRWAAYVALPYALTDNFTIQPEIGYYNYGDRVCNSETTDMSEESAGDEWLVGIHFSVSF